MVSYLLVSCFRFRLIIISDPNTFQFNYALFVEFSQHFISNARFKVKQSFFVRRKYDVR